MKIKYLIKEDIQLIVDAFRTSNWTIKEGALFEQYLNEQAQGKRVCWVAKESNEIAGYVTVKWESEYLPFLEKKIPEIVDLNVLPNFRRKGIATVLLNEAEKLIHKRSNLAGIGVGLYNDYGPAQRLYINRGYLPDGNGITYHYQATTAGKEYCLDDDLILWFTKKLKD